MRENTPSGLFEKGNIMKKYLSLMLAVLILAVALVSCFGGGNNKTTTTTQPTTTQPDDVPVDPPVDTHEHSYSVTVTEPTCTEQGYTTYTCECSDSYVSDYVSPTHRFGEWVTVKEATATEEGLQERTCECGEKETQFISAKGSEGLEFSYVRYNDETEWYLSASIGDCTDTHIIIPSMYEGELVTCVNRFLNNTTITSITIPYSVTRIGTSAFSGSTTLSSVEFGENSQLTKIDVGAFYNCASLTSVDLGSNQKLTTIDKQAFEHCGSLTSVILPDSVTNIGDRAFSWCYSLRNITFKGTVEQWNAIEKGEEWNDNVPATEVICSDGTVPLN